MKVNAVTSDWHIEHRLCVSLIFCAHIVHEKQCPQGMNTAETVYSKQILHSN